MNDKVRTPDFPMVTSTWIDAVKATTLGFVQAAGAAVQHQESSPYFAAARDNSRWQQRMRSFNTTTAEA